MKRCVLATLAWLWLQLPYNIVCDCAAPRGNVWLHLLRCCDCNMGECVIATWGKCVPTTSSILRFATTSDYCVVCNLKEVCGNYQKTSVWFETWTDAWLQLLVSRDCNIEKIPLGSDAMFIYVHEVCNIHYTTGASLKTH
jgi:hypothetical protein